jgi:hypothetical protein
LPGFQIIFHIWQWEGEAQIQDGGALEVIVLQTLLSIFQNQNI